MFRICDTEAASWQICTGLERPSRSGPTTVAPPSACTSLVEMEAVRMMDEALDGVRRLDGDLHQFGAFRQF
jgi:hypothetical protein